MTGWAVVALHKAKCIWLAALGHSRPRGDVMTTQGDLGFVFSSDHPGKSVCPPQRAPAPSLPSLWGTGRPADAAPASVTLSCCSRVPGRADVGGGS